MDRLFVGSHGSSGTTLKKLVYAYSLKIFLEFPNFFPLPTSDSMTSPCYSPTYSCYYSETLCDSSLLPNKFWILQYKIWSILWFALPFYSVFPDKYHILQALKSLAFWNNFCEHLWLFSNSSHFLRERTNIAWHKHSLPKGNLNTSLCFQCFI